LLRNPAPDIEKHEFLPSLISEFSCDPDVQKVSVNSTLNKRYIRNDDAEEREACDGKERATGHDKEGRLVDGKISQLLGHRIQKKVGQKIGRAFIICNQHEDSKYGVERKKALKNANAVLKEYFDFEVSFYNNCFDKIVAYQSVLKTESMIPCSVKTFLEKCFTFCWVYTWLT